MPITLLDVILIGVMLISAILAMIRGFMREILSIAAWVLAALTTLYSYGKLLPYARSYVNNDIVATGAVVAGLDRTLGFLFGLARGLIIVVVAFLFFVWLVPAKTQPAWVANAKSKVVLQSTGDWLMSMLPDDPESTILKRFKRPQPEDSEPAEGPPGQRGSLDATTSAPI
jgi:membrane protein required for colicin V production